jgi:predicted transcriptional regulator of viral defense system
MVFNTLLELMGDESIFDTSLLLSGDIDPGLIRLQLSRWVKSRKVYQLRRGLYALAPPYQKTKLHPFQVANRLKKASYVSLQSALSFYGLIPEVVNSTTSVCTGRPNRWVNPLGVYEFRHLKTELFFGYRPEDLSGQSAFMATPEKALLDLIYFHPQGELVTFIEELRLQNLEQLDTDILKDHSKHFGTPKIQRAVKSIIKLKDEETGTFEEL